MAQDYIEAAKWYRKAAEQGDARAQHNLGILCGNGEGVPQNSEEAAKWFRKAAEQGVARSQYNLGLMYSNGDGVPKNYERAYAWINLAAAREPKYAKSRDEVAKRMTLQQIATAQELSMELQKEIEKITK